MEIINGHTFSYFYAGIVTYVVDGNHYYDLESTAKALGVSVQEIKMED